MRPLRVVVLDVLPHQVVEMLLAEDQEVVQALDLQRLNEPLDEGIGVGRPDGRSPSSDSFRRQDVIEPAVEEVVVPADRG